MGTIGGGIHCSQPGPLPGPGPGELCIGNCLNYILLLIPVYVCLRICHTSPLYVYFIFRSYVIF